MQQTDPRALKAARHNKSHTWFTCRTPRRVFGCERSFRHVSVKILKERIKTKTAPAPHQQKHTTLTRRASWPWLARMGGIAHRYGRLAAPRQEEHKIPPVNHQHHSEPRPKEADARRHAGEESTNGNRDHGHERECRHSKEPYLSEWSAGMARRSMHPETLRQIRRLRPQQPTGSVQVRRTGPGQQTRKNRWTRRSASEERPHSRCHTR